MTNTLPHADAFVARMTEHWSTTLECVATPKLKAIWAIMADTFSDKIDSHDTDTATEWRVLYPETGTGKTQGLCVYCAMLPEAEHPGVLIVTRMKAQADEIAETINALTGRADAVAYHTDNKLPGEELADYPVLIITHAAFQLSMDSIAQQRGHASAWDFYFNWSIHGRKLIVIDEALDLVDECCVTADAVEWALGNIPRDIKTEFPREVDAAKEVIKLIDLAAALAAEEGQKAKETVRWNKPRTPQCTDLTTFRQALKGVDFARLSLGRPNAQADTVIRGRVLDILKGVQDVLSQWAYYARTHNGDTLNTARLIIPRDTSGVVVMDATAPENRVYDVFDRCKLIPTERARTYKNVTLRISKGHAVGKRILAKNAKREVPRLFANLQETLDKDRKVLVLCHKWVEPYLAAYKDQHFKAFDVAHWGALDGRNDWVEFDTVIVYGLPYLPSTRAPNIFFALQGVQSSEWLNGGITRSFSKWRDIREALDTSHVVTSVIQGINRIRSRKVIDTEGNCDPVEILLLLPDGKYGDAVERGILRQMPDTGRGPWQFDHNKRRARASNHAEALIRYAQNLPSGGYLSASTVKSDLGISPSQWDRLVSDMKKPDTDLHQRLITIGARYEVERRGKTQVGRLTRE